MSVPDNRLPKRPRPKWHYLAGLIIPLCLCAALASVASPRSNLESKQQAAHVVMTQLAEQEATRVATVPPSSTPVATPVATIPPTEAPPAAAVQGCTSGERTGATCKDGYHDTRTGSGACSGHKGVAQWVLCP